MEFEDQDDQTEEIELLPEMPNPTVVIDAPPQQQRKPRYRECLKNHAVGLGGHAVDGCGEFLPAGPDGSLDALKCAACSCHRNFHRKETDSSSSSPSSAANDAAAAAAFNFSPHPHFLLPPHHHPQQFPPYYRTPSGYLHVAPPRPLALPSTSGGPGGSYSREDEEDMSGLNNNNNNTSSGGGGSGAGGKRYRTKFSAEQKERMLELAEKLGWRIQKHDDEVIQAFCNETGVKRHVLKVWMHNNKHTLGKKP